MITSQRAKPAFAQLTTVVSSPEPICETDRFEPTVSADVPYRILSATGLCLGYAHSLQQALDNFNAWNQATAITLGNLVVLQRKGVRT